LEGSFCSLFKEELMKLSRLCTGLVIVGFVLQAGGALAQDIKDRTLKFAHQNSKEHPQGQGVAKFAELVAQKSGGKIKVQQFAGGQLGGDLQNVSALQGGTVDLVVLNTGLLVGIVKETALVDLPFLFNTPQEADAVMDGPFGKKLAEKVAEKNLINLGYFELGFRNITNSKRPINKMEDIAGLKLRVLQSPLFIDTFSALGANPTPMPFPEVYSALEQKVVDGQENPVSVILDSKFAEVQKNLALTRHIYNPQSVLISKKTWDSMSAAEKKIIQDAATEATAYQRKLNRDKSNEALEALKKAGMQVTELPPAEVAKIREKLKPVVAKYAAQAGDQTFGELNAEIAKVRK
jgi:tripartite ATP-independent transporter DctP family solute receptor